MKKENKKLATKISDPKLATIAIKVENISKAFRIPHEKHTSLKEAALNVFEKKTYEEFVALKDVNFEVKKGEFFGIIGRNGSGKSTLLKILAGIYMADEGKVEVNGKLSPFLELGVGFNPELTARENVFLGGAVLGLSRKEIEEKFDEIIKFSELEEFVDMKFKNFSSGMQVKLAFSLSIHAHADILLMDEVLAVGDSNFQSKCIREFLNYKEEGKTIVLVSHDLNTVERFCDRILYIKDSRVELIAPPVKAIERYTSDMASENKSEYKQRVHGKSFFKSTLLLNQSNKKTEILLEGERFSVNIKYEMEKKVPGLVVGMTILKDGNNLIFGTNTERNNLIIKNSKKGEVVFNFGVPNLSQGAYSVNVALGLEDGTLIEKRESSIVFNISKSSGRNYGIVNLSPDVGYKELI